MSTTKTATNIHKLHKYHLYGIKEELVWEEMKEHFRAGGTTREANVNKRK